MAHNPLRILSILFLFSGLLQAQPGDYELDGFVRNWFPDAPTEIGAAPAKNFVVQTEHRVFMVTLVDIPSEYHGFESDMDDFFQGYLKGALKFPEFESDYREPAHFGKFGGEEVRGRFETPDGDLKAIVLVSVRLGERILTRSITRDIAVAEGQPDQLFLSSTELLVSIPAPSARQSRRGGSSKSPFEMGQMVGMALAPVVLALLYFLWWRRRKRAQR